MGDAADDLEYRQWREHERSKAIIKALKKQCRRDKCDGTKTISNNGRLVVCECGRGGRNNSEL